MRQKLTVVLMATALSPLALAVSAAEKTPPAKPLLTLKQYLDDVKAGSPAARAANESVAAFELRLNESELLVTPEIYAEVARLDDQKPAMVPAMSGKETRVDRWKAGFRGQTRIGLGADIYFQSQRTNLDLQPSIIMPTTNFMESATVLQLTQSFWRNGFGEGTRAKMAAARAEAEAGLMKSRYQLKELLLNAQNAYWSMVSMNQIVKLQQENVERAKRLRDYMVNKAKQKLFDDVDAMQTQASFESRELELQKSLDDRDSLIRKFNTLRGLDSDEMPALDELPTNELMMQVAEPPSGRMSRDDFEQMRAEARVLLNKARDRKSELQPKLDLVGSVAANGKDAKTSDSYYQSTTDRYPTWSIGINFSAPIDFFLTRNLNRGYRQAQVAAEYLEKSVEFNETRAWDDIVKQKKEARGRFERAVSIEKLQTELVKRQRQRLLNGRSTTFEMINFEQTLALAQIQRVKNQLDLLQIHNAIKTFEAKP